MQNKIVQVFCDRLRISIDYQEQVANNLEKLTKNNLVKIVSTLAGTYESNSQEELNELLKEITIHIVKGDFKEWRYSHAKSSQQLEGLSQDQIDIWKNNLEPIEVKEENSEDLQGKISNRIDTLQIIIKNAKDHILEIRSDLYFSDEKLSEYTQEINGLIQAIKNSENNKKVELINKKNRLTSEKRLIEGILNLDRVDISDFNQKEILQQVNLIKGMLGKLGFQEALTDIEQIFKIFTLEEVNLATAIETDNEIDLLNVGVEPLETCQSWRKGTHNYCLLAYVADSNKKLINVVDQNGKLIARSVIKLTDQRDDSDINNTTRRKTILIEKPYTLSADDEVVKALAKMVFAKASAVDVSITIDSQFSERMMQFFEDQAKRNSYIKKDLSLEIYTPESMNIKEYSDVLGGDISHFNQYKKLSATTFEKK
ncbi:MAG: hypothetical protein GF335_04480 [Candidatus Moranbacteria bacterium]|nr:hypothetical protein [Candidatus Moranbacteria bacterium]